MIRAKKKQIYNNTIEPTLETCSVLLEYGTASLQASINILGLEIHTTGNYNLTSLLENNWLVEYRNNKIIVVDLEGVGSKSIKLFSIQGLMKIKKLIAIDINQNYVTAGQTSDDFLYKWNFDKGTKLNENTTTWDSLNTTNQSTTYTGNEENIKEDIKNSEQQAYPKES